MAKKKKRKSNMMPALITALVLSVVTGIIVVIGIFSGNNTRKTYVATGTKEDVMRETDTHRDTAPEWSVSINLFNCTMRVGTVLDVTATVRPEGAAVSWFSSNTEALVIDQTGRAVVVGKGITTITASMGNLNDTVIVECVAEDGRSALGFPLYENLQLAAMPENSGEVVPTEASGETGTAGMPQNVPTAQDTGKKATTAGGVTQAQVTQTGSSPTKETTQKATQTTTKAANPTTAAYTQPALKPLSDIDSRQVGAYMGQFGFSQHSDGTYVYEKDKICYGEVILDNEKTHLYIMQNQENFNLAAVSVMAKLLPESYENVWKAAQGAHTDMAMTVDGRNVRIVVPQSGGHKQIVIFN